MIRSQPVGNPDEVTVQDMKKALDNPSLGIKVIHVRSPREIGAAANSWGKPEKQPRNTPNTKKGTDDELQTLSLGRFSFA